MRKPTTTCRRGQAALEYVLVLSALLVVAGMAWHLVRAARNASTRTVNLVSSDYP